MVRNFSGRKIVVVGAGRSGLGLAAYFRSRGAQVRLSDHRPAAEFADLESLRATGADLDLGGHTTELFVDADMVAISPGVSLEIPAIAAALRAGVPVLGEVEVAFGELTAPLVGITGTNGKSTTTLLMGRIFEAWGKRVFTGGNLGIPLIEAVDHDYDWLAVELSSFQLEAIRDFRPRYALLLNISEDHLDRYPDMTEYVAAKARIFENMAGDDVAVLSAEDGRVAEVAGKIAARKVWFSSRRPLDEGMGFADGEILWRMAGDEERFQADELRLKGMHNLENVMAAMIPPLMEGCPAEVAWGAVREFTGLPHRMEPVRVLDGVTWYDDSKGTNVGSVVKSLAGLDAPVTLIAGGKDKGGDYAPLIEPVRSKVGHLLLIGEAADRIAETLAGTTDVLRVPSLEAAVRRARELTPAGGAVLLSPGCSSFDMFSGFEERGEVFARAVQALPEEEVP